jgi:hypothetical protein
LLLLAALLAVLMGCSRPTDRPQQGAAPGSGRAPDLRGVDVPATLSPPQLTAGVAAPSPVVVVALTASPSPAIAGRNPIISGLAPGQDATVPPGPVTISARVAASSELSEASLSLNGAPVQSRVAAAGPLIWQVSYSGDLAAGTYAAQINARDRDGRAGGFRWQFTVGNGAPPATPATTPSTAPAPKPIAPTAPPPTAPPTTAPAPPTARPATPTPARR